MAAHDPLAREINAKLRARFGRTPEVERAIKKTMAIRALTSGGMDYAHTLTQVYNRITGGNHGKQEVP
jgi:hypothetical protein